MKVEGTEPHYQIVVDKSGVMDEMEVQVEVSQEVFSDEIKQLEAFKQRIAEEIYSVLGLTAKITLVEPKSIERSMGKAKRVIDARDVKKGD
jgi:phenylacetate-CoA ligase